MTNKHAQGEQSFLIIALFTLYSAMMRNDKIDVQVVIKLSNISDEKYTYLQGVKA